MQPKLLAVKDGSDYRPARLDETSTYIAKLPSGSLRDIVENEFLVLHACRLLLPSDTIVDAVIAPLKGIGDKALLVPRFDRLRSGARIHFEEFNELLGHRSGDDKYDAAYEDMASFIVKTPGCAPADAWRLYERVLVCLLTGNTDAHLKNFAMLHTPDGLRLSPAYDLVAAALYPEIPHLCSFDWRRRQSDHRPDQAKTFSGTSEGLQSLRRGDPANRAAPRSPTQSG